MKHFFLLTVSLFSFCISISVFADDPSSFYTKAKACGLSDTNYNGELSISSDDSTAISRGFIKFSNILYYVVISESYTKQELFSYNCKTKKATLIKDVTLNPSLWMNAKIDYMNSTHIFIKYSGEARGEEYEGVYNRKNKNFRELIFANNDIIQSQYEKDFGSDEPPYRVVDITTGKGGKLMVWITWGTDMLRALSLDTKTFTVTNVTWNYAFRMQGESDAWLKVSNGKLFGRGNVGGWYEIPNRDIRTFRALTGYYGRDRLGYSIPALDSFLPTDALHKSYELWYSPSKKSLYGYHAGDTYTVAVNDPSTLQFTGYTDFSNQIGTCRDTTGSYGYKAYDSQFCYGDISGAAASIGIVGKMKSN